MGGQQSKAMAPKRPQGRFLAWCGRMWRRLRPQAPEAFADPSAASYTVLFVCMGNICRSPTAEVVLRHKLHLAGLGRHVTVRSVGTHADWHADQGADPRAVQHARRRGYDLQAFRARSLSPSDFVQHDLILAMDDENFGVLQDRCPPEHRSKLGRLASHGQLGMAAIPDPYYGPPEGFERVLDLVEDACEGLVRRLAHQVPIAGGELP